MNLVDFAIAGVSAVSTLISFKRGFVKEALSLVSWVAAFIVARVFSGHLAPLMEDYIVSPSLQLGVAFVVLFATTLIVGAMLNHLLAEMVRLTGLAGTDRLFGMVFGLARGMVVALVIITIVSRTPFIEDKWWKKSILIPHFMVIEEWAREVLVDYSSDFMDQF